MNKKHHLGDMGMYHRVSVNIKKRFMESRDI